MNAVQRFFRRYIISTIGIVVLFLAVNIVLFFAILILGSMSGSDAVFSVETFSDHVSRQDGTWRADDVARSMLEEHDAWAMLLNEEGSRTCRRICRAPIPVQRWPLSAVGIWRIIPSKCGRGQMAS